MKLKILLIRPNVKSVWMDIILHQQLRHVRYVQIILKYPDAKMKLKKFCNVIRILLFFKQQHLPVAFLAINFVNSKKLPHLAKLAIQITF